jgi:hypothetical protein
MRRLPVVLSLLLGVLLAGASLGVSPASAACTAGSKSDAAKVQLWADKGCGGATAQIGFAGEDDRPDFRSFATRSGEVKNINNDRSSIGLAGGWCAKLFDPLNYGEGDAGIFCAVGRTTYHDIGGLNDRASSMRVCPETDRGLCNRIPKSEVTPTPTPTPEPTPDPCAEGACEEPPPDPCETEGICDDGGEVPGELEEFGPNDGLRFDRAGRGCRGSSTSGARALRTWLREESGVPIKRTGQLYRCGRRPARGKRRDLHSEGRAIDVVPTSEEGALDLITLLLADEYALARRMGVQEIIYDGRVWSSARPTRQLRRYRGRSPHRRSVHVGLNKRGAAMRTSFWDGR